MTSHRGRPPTNTSALLPEPIAIGISPSFLVDAEINPLQYGQFIEYLADVVPGMWAEKLSDCSFEGLGEWKWNFIKATDGVDRPWYPAGQVNCASYELDPENPVSGAVSQRVRTLGDPPCTVGIAQDGVAFSADEPLDLSVWLRGTCSRGTVTAELLDRDGTVARCEFAVRPQWTKHTARIRPVRGSFAGTISFTFRGPGDVWFDNVSLMPTDTVDGWRRDVFEAVKAMRPGVIRYGGCAVDNTDDPKHFAFDWQDTIGDPDRRRPFWAWGGIQHTGPGLEEIVRFIQAVGAEVMLAVRVSKRMPKDAADMVEYFNGSADTPMGGRRASNGRREPYRIRYWQVGNELGGDAYEAVLPAFCLAMRAVDPGIVLLSSFPSDRTLTACPDQIDYLCPHHYRIRDLAGVAADLDLNARRCLSSPRRVRIGITEWGVTATEPGLQRAKLWSLAGALAGARYRNLLHRRCDLVEISNRSNMANSICTGAIQTDRSRIFLTPAYHVERLYSTLAGNRVLTVAMPPGSPLDVNATYRAGLDPALTLFIVNQTLNAVACRFDLSGFSLPSTRARTWTLADRLAAGEPEVANSFREPDRVSPVEGDIRVEDGMLRSEIPALALVVVQITGAVRAS